MNAQFHRHPQSKIWARLKKYLWEGRRVVLTACGIAGGVSLLRLTGSLQPVEWAALDGYFRLRPLEPKDSRVAIVGIDEAALRQHGFPISDAVMAQLLQKLSALNPRAIGLDIYRDRPVEPGYAELQKAFTALPNLVAIEKIPTSDDIGVAPPPVLSQSNNNIGFSNLIVDSDGKVRRSLLFWHVDGKAHRSLALQLALKYLQAEGISLEYGNANSKQWRLGKGAFKIFEANDGAYIRADDAGYQVLTNFRGPVGSFRTVSIADVLENRVPPEWVRDRVILIGSTAPTVKDLFYTPHSTPQRMFGVELHANFISQLLAAALDGRTFINTLSDPVEYLWIFSWSWIGAALSWRVRSPRWSPLSIILAGATLVGICYLAFIFGWWLPLVPPAIALFGSALSITSYFAHLEQELKKSKEFLSTVINTIPDPIFVKDKQQRWIVLNQAYCQFIGYSYEHLIQKSDKDFFPLEEAEIFGEQDRKVFESGKSQENEEKFTDARGNTYSIATKRSLHKDAAGNLFLVGVIRDITERKRMEEELKRTATELARSNEELKVSEDRLRYLAYHDTLTGLANRKLFYERLSQALEWARMNSQMVALLFIDLDGFKTVNDSLGHDIGDLLLKAVAGRLTGCLRASDTVSRLGGDEFTVILPAIPGVPDAARVAEKILDTLSAQFLIRESPVSVSASIGIGLYPLHGEDADSLINTADAAMYRAKEQGKNRYEVS